MTAAPTPPPSDWDPDADDLDQFRASFDAPSPPPSPPAAWTPPADQPPQQAQQQAQQAATPAGRNDDAILFFDLETVPDYERLHWFDLPPLPEPQPETSSAECGDPAEWLKMALEPLTERIRRVNCDAAFLELLIAEEAKAAKPRAGVAERCRRILAARVEIRDAEEKRRKMLATTPECCRIVALGMQTLAGDEVASPKTLVVQDPTGEQGPDHEANDEAERELLRRFWKAAIGRRVCGYNILSFDLPVILARSILLGVDPSCQFDLRGYDRRVLDLMVARYGRGMAGSPAKLKTLARFYGLRAEAEGVDGSQVERLLREDPEALARYVRSDVDLVVRLYRAWQGYFC